MEMKENSFTKSERLKSRKVIESLFKAGHSFAAYPLRLVWAPVELQEHNARILFSLSVSKRNFKTAVARNRIKRKVREAWRLNKNKLYSKLPEDGTVYSIMVIYTAREELPSSVIHDSVKKMNAIFLKKIRKDG